MKNRKIIFWAGLLLCAALPAWWYFHSGTKPAPTDFKTPPPVKTWEQPFHFNWALTGGTALRAKSVDCGGSVIWKNIDSPPPKELLDKIQEAVLSELEDVVGSDLQEDKSAQARSKLESKMRDALNNFLKSEKADFEIDSVNISEFKLSMS